MQIARYAQDFYNVIKSNRRSLIPSSNKNSLNKYQKRLALEAFSNLE